MSTTSKTNLLSQITATSNFIADARYELENAAAKDANLKPIVAELKATHERLVEYVAARIEKK